MSQINGNYFFLVFACVFSVIFFRISFRFTSFLRPLVQKIKTYCLRFKSVLTRAFKYDANLLEYFVETGETVKVRRSDLERRTEEVNDEAGEPAPKSLLDKPRVKALEDRKEGQSPNEGNDKPGGEVGTLEETKENLQKFLESLHKKASQASTWILTLEGQSMSEKHKEYLVCIPYLLFGWLKRKHEQFIWGHVFASYF